MPASETVSPAALPALDASALDVRHFSASFDRTPRSGRCAAVDACVSRAVRGSFPCRNLTLPPAVFLCRPRQIRLYRCACSFARFSATLKTGSIRSPARTICGRRRGWSASSGSTSARRSCAFVRHADARRRGGGGRGGAVLVCRPAGRHSRHGASRATAGPG